MFPIFQTSDSMLAVILCMVAGAFWAQRFKPLKLIGPALLVIITGIILVNLNIVTGSCELYGVIQTYCIPLSTSLYLLNVDFKKIVKMSKQPLMSIGSAVFCVCLVTIIFGSVFAGQIEEGWKVAGIFQDQAEIDALNKQAAEKTNGEITAYQMAETQPGDYKYVDINGDGYVNDEDRTVLGNGYPKLNYGLNLSAAYKGWDFSLYMYGVLGQDILSYSNAVLTSVFDDQGGYQNTLADYMVNAWTPENHSTKYPRLTRANPNHNSRVSDAYINNGDFLRISNLQVGYTFPKEWIRHARMESLRIYASVENLATITGYKYGEPEVGDSNVLRTGFDGGRYPFPRSFVFGLSVQF